MTRQRPARSLLLPLVPVYRLGLALRDLSLRMGWEPVRHLTWPVVSIGNLSTGGAGKTPLTIALAQALTRRGVSVDVLSRGYGRTNRHPVQVDPDGAAEDFGDEPLVIAREALVPIYVAAKRYQAGLLAERSRKPAHGLHLLDDGFQHRQLARDLDILLVNRQDWHDRLLPAGNLREPRSALQRATVIAIPAEEPELAAELRASGWRGPVWRLHRRMEIPPVAGPAIAFCGIARPQQFFAGLESAGLHLASRVAFADHHRYIRHDLDCLLDAARSVQAAAFITTEKDRARLGSLAANFPESPPLKAVTLRIEIEGESAAVDWLMEQIASRSRALTPSRKSSSDKAPTPE